MELRANGSKRQEAGVKAAATTAKAKARCRPEGRRYDGKGKSGRVGETPTLQVQKRRPEGRRYDGRGEYVRTFRRLSVCVAALLMLTSACVCARAQTDTGKPAGASAAKVDSGKRAFASAGCVACHGAQGQGTNVAPQIAPPPLEVPAFMSYVRQPTGTMPPVSADTASDQKLSDIYAYLKSVAPASQAGEAGAAGNAANGKKLFLAYGCYQCHGYVGQGGSAGPRIGPPPLSLAFLLSYVRHPARQMPPYTEKVVSDQDLTDIFAYLKSMPQPAAASSIPILNQ